MVVPPVENDYSAQNDVFGQHVEEAKHYANGKKIQDVIPAEYSSSYLPDSEQRKF